MAANNVVETILKLRGSREFQSAAKAAGKSIAGIGDETEKSGEKARIGWKGIAKWAGGTAAIYSAGRFLKGAVSTTEALANSTIKLQRSTGLDAKAASEWAEITKVRGIDTAKFQVSLTKLSRTLEAARQGSKSAESVISQLGITQATVASGNVQQAIFEAADAYADMTNPAQKAALAQQAFGRSSQALTPLLSKGSAGIRDQLGLAGRLGNALGDKTVEGAKKTAEAERNMRMASDGLKVTIGVGLMPALEGAITNFARLVGWLQPLLRNTKVVTAAIGVLTTVFLVNKAAAFAASLAQLGLTRAFIRTRVATLLTTLSVMGLNASMLLIPLALAAVVIGLVVLYKKWGWFHNAVNNTWQFIRGHWKLLFAILTGPFGLAAVFIVKHFEAIKHAAGNALNWIASRVQKVLALAGKVTGAVGGVVKHIPGASKVLGAFASGGPVVQTGPYLVGERGPEVVSLNAGQRVFPTPALASGGVPNFAGAPPLDERPIVVQLVTNGRVLAETVATYNSDRRARR